ncbi:30S ribosomal protein S20 [bacterium]|nr:30S ribosomal protein S20 [bacterium]
MANNKSSKKNILINERNRQRNLKYKTLVKSVIKRALSAISENTEGKAEIVKNAMRTIDKTVTKGVTHKKAAARRKSRLARALNASA